MKLVFALMPVMASAQQVSRPPSPCASCHEEALAQPATSMGHALESVEECQVLARHPLLTFKKGAFSYRIERKGDQSLYTVTDGTETLTLPIRWAMGASSAIGQTYILEKEGQLYESRVSYFAELKGLGLTMGAANVEPTNIVDAAGRLMGLEDKLQCFGCHATNATAGRKPTLDLLTAGVQCERCHGPSKEHLASMTGGNATPVKMKDLSVFSTEQMSNFCGQCHRTWEDVVLAGRLDITDVRFQPYRLASSSCYDADDKRISCMACHNPHHNVDTRSVDYDSKCQACHGGGKAGAKVCVVAKKNCVTCHMPKIVLPGAYHRFSDHRIRVVKPSEPFPG
ncbi:MAG TPA: multiheme c-type cytochrome [Terriglobia bacterium]|nr:multiheme c-type cytochrome [Terriglobia bacterium]